MIHTLPIPLLTLSSLRRLRGRSPTGASHVSRGGASGAGRDAGSMGGGLVGEVSTTQGPAWAAQARSRPPASTALGRGPWRLIRVASHDDWSLPGWWWWWLHHSIRLDGYCRWGEWICLMVADWGFGWLVSLWLTSSGDMNEWSYSENTTEYHTSVACMIIQIVFSLSSTTDFCLPLLILLPVYDRRANGFDVTTCWSTS